MKYPGEGTWEKKKKSAVNQVSGEWSERVEKKKQRAEKKVNERCENETETIHSPNLQRGS